MRASLLLLPQALQVTLFIYWCCCMFLGNEKTWYLSRECKLEPEYVQELVAEKRTVRPPGQWTVTAKITTVTGQAQEPPIDLVGDLSGLWRQPC